MAPMFGARSEGVKVTGSFYSPLGEEMELSDFLALYTHIYFCQVRNLDLDRAVTSALKNKEKTRENVRDLLLWKTGGSCGEDGEYVSYRGQKIDLNKVWQAFTKTREERDPKAMLADFLHVKGVGPVIAIALVWYVLGGKYPIYDQFAHKGLIAIQKALEPRNRIDGFLNRHYIGRLSGLSAGAVLAELNQYKQGLIEVFGQEALTDRGVDQALWAYGHLF